MSRSRAAVAFAVCLFACSNAAEKSGPDSVAPPATEDPTTPPPLECDDGTYATSAGTCEPFPKLAIARSPVAIAPTRDHHTSMVIETSSGAWLYVVGGTDAWQTLHDDVQRAKIADDGSLGPFETIAKLPEARAGHCMVKKGDRLYLFGGIVGIGRATPSTSSVVLSLDAEGKVTAAAPGPAIPTGVMHLSCELAGDYVYVLGGRNASGRSSTLSARAKIDASGAISEFTKQTTLAPDRSHHASFVRERRLYLVGGLTGDPTKTFEDRKDIVYADIDEDGALGSWTAAGTLPTSVSVSSAQLYKDAVYVFGGLEDGLFFSDKIRRGTFAADGSLSPFTVLTTTLPDPRGHVHQTPVWRSFIYSVGGKDRDDRSLGAVDVGRFE